MKGHALGLLLALAACSSNSTDAPPTRDAGRTRRVIEPPPGEVRPVPPHAIDAGGVGPYRLGVTQDELFAALTSIPRVATLDVDGILDASVVRTEDDTILVGGRRGERTSFAAVLAPGIARTEGGLAVGARRAELAALGPELDDPRTARDPRLVVLASLPGARFVLDGDRVQAIFLRAVDDPPPRPDAGAGAAGCVATAPPGARGEPACFTSAGREALVVGSTTIAAIDATGARGRAVEIPGLVWAAPLRNDYDRDEVVAIAQRRDAQELVVTLLVHRYDGGRLVKTVEQPVYTLTATGAQWIGAQLADVELMLVVTARSDRFDVGGLLVHAVGGSARDVAPLVPVQVPRRRRSAADPVAPPPAPVDARPADDAAVDDAAP